MFTYASSTNWLEIRWFSRRSRAVEEKMYKKKYAARVELLFYSTNLMLFFAILAAVAVFVSTIKTWPNRKPRMKVSGTQGVTHPHPVHCK